MDTAPDCKSHTWSVSVVNRVIHSPAEDPIGSVKRHRPFPYSKAKIIELCSIIARVTEAVRKKS